MATKGAPMPQKEEDIVNNSMKLYTYLVCISGLATYPSNTRMFRQKNLMFTEIKKATGLTNDTVKLYLYYLEQNHMIRYQGKYKFQPLDILDNGISAKEYRRLCLEQAKETWALRYKNEKDGVYHIPRPDPFIPIPEQTLQKLNEFFECSELELKLYLWCCNYVETCEYYNKKIKGVSFEMIRDSFKIKDDRPATNKHIRMALIFLKAIGLIDYEEGKGMNSKKVPIPVFKIKTVNYYIDYDISDFTKDELITEEEFLEILKRIQ